jgi:hypothetical protein
VESAHAKFKRKGRYLRTSNIATTVAHGLSVMDGEQELFNQLITNNSMKKPPRFRFDLRI